MVREFKILIIDDDVNLASNLQDILQAEGYSVSAAPGAEVALNLCREKVFDLALVDIRLPGISRMELTEKITDLIDGVEYIIITGYASLDSAIDTVSQKNIVGYVTKPVNMGHLLTIVKQVFERRQVEKQLAREKEKAKDYLNIAGVMLSAVSADEKITMMNKKGCDITGYKEEELLGKNWFDLLLPERIRDVVRVVFRKLVAGEIGPAEYYENPLVTKGGEERLVAFHYTVIKESSGQIVGVLTSGEDITERKKMESQLILTDRLASIGELASGIAHELNNPLTSVIGLSDLLLAKHIPGDIKEDLEVINAEAKRTAKVVRNLLTFARRHETQKSPTDVNGAIKVILALRAYEQKVNNILVNTRFASDLPEIMADTFQLQQVFLNIIINAEYFMIEAHRGGTLTITTERVGDFIRASLADDGPGVTEENLKHVFDPFFTTKEVGKGTGLGLSICHGIITEHGGRIYAESELGKGVNFIIELPIKQ